LSGSGFWDLIQGFILLSGYFTALSVVLGIVFA
jgi:hypothetical protein